MRLTFGGREEEEGLILNWQRPLKTMTERKKSRRKRRITIVRVVTLSRSKEKQNGQRHSSGVLIPQKMSNQHSLPRQKNKELSLI